MSMDTAKYAKRMTLYTMYISLSICIENKMSWYTYRIYHITPTIGPTD